MLRFKNHFIAFVVLMFCLVPIAHAQIVPQQGAINTSRSNIKNTSRTLGGRIDQVTVDLEKASGEKVASRKLTDTDKDGKLSDSEGKFDFGILPEGKYALVITVDATIDNGTNRTASKEAENIPAKLVLTLEGTKDGAIQKSLKWTTKGSDDAIADQTARTGLQGQIAALEGKQSAERPGRTQYKIVILETDGKSAVKGKIKHETVKNSINNVR